MIEILVVISIIGFLAVSGNYFFSITRMKARDSYRVASIKQIQNAIDYYYDEYNTWPDSNDDDCFDTWDYGYCLQDKSDGFIQELESSGYFGKTPGDPYYYGGALGNGNPIMYKVYDAGSEGCDPASGRFYVLAIADLETDVNPPEVFSGSGFACGDRDWQDGFDYVVGKFEKK